MVEDFSCFLDDLNSYGIDSKTDLNPNIFLPSTKRTPCEHSIKQMKVNKAAYCNSMPLATIKNKTLTKLFETGKAYFIRFSNMDRLVLPSGL